MFACTKCLIALYDAGMVLCRQVLLLFGCCTVHRYMFRSCKQGDSAEPLKGPTVADSYSSRTDVVGSMLNHSDELL